MTGARYRLTIAGDVGPLCTARCGKTLTDPVSIARGYGPVCWKRLPAEAQAAIALSIPAKSRPASRPARTPKTPKTTRHHAPAENASQLELTDNRPARFEGCPDYGPHCATSRACRWPLCIPTTEAQD